MAAAPKLKSRFLTQPSPILTEIRPLPKPQISLWQKALLGIQWVSGVAATSALVAVLPLYGWSALSEQQWSQAYQRLETLKRQERELLINNETLRYRVTQQVQRAPQGLLPQTPQHILFLPNEGKMTPRTHVERPPVTPPPQRTVNY
ncbi:hypothetical protein NBE99_07040 [Thermosynechococcus sp. HN-54]|uniref:hypothetical protein n=1 Tax=Thermosynechococcus sp. HN-54 TaxID=2933959 RepID=UPI00202CC803|nr:hypothetical protein [Thermosynechococcus sp. HN-54]URR34410.1 hypothetical protein NBE99_07040 [Thermosynechococcus sp. HN-54]